MAFAYDQPYLAPGTILQSRYRIVRVVGGGGMGAVYLAEHLTLGSHVAVKEMRSAHTNPTEQLQAVQQFQAEAQILSRLHHINLPRVYDFFTENQRWYLVMDYIQGQTLEALLVAQQHPFAEPQVLAWTMQLCDVLAYLHGQQPPIIFRDLKPANVMLETATGRIKLIDFGIARHFVPGKQTDTLRMGTIGYAPPEQYAGQGQTTVRADQYALAATIHRLLTGHDPTNTPFVFPPVRPMNPTVSQTLADVIVQALNYDPARRFGSIEDLRQALLGRAFQCPRSDCRAFNRPQARFCAACGRPITGVLETTRVERSVTPPRRPRWPIAAAGVGIAALLVCLLGGGGGAFLWWQAQVTPTSTRTPWVIAGQSTSTPGPTAALTMTSPAFTATSRPPTATAIPRRLILEDDFSNPNSGWSVSDDATSTERYVEGAFSILIKKARIYVPRCKGDYTNGILEIDVMHVSGGDELAGLMFRSTSNHDDFYTLRVAPSGRFAVEKHSKDQGFVPLLARSNSTYVKGRGQWNHLRVEFRGPTIVPYINGYQVDAGLKDSSYQQGCIGFVACTCDGSESVEVRFDNLKLYAVE